MSELRKKPTRTPEGNAARSAGRMARLDAEVAKMYAYYQEGHSLAETGAKFGGRDQSSISKLFINRNLKARKGPGPDGQRKKGLTYRARLDGLVASMYADYNLPMSLAAVGRKYKRDRRSISELFVRRGLAVRPVAYEIKRLPNGCIEPAKPLTAEEITALIDRSTKLKVPVELKHEWRKWSLARRGEFIAQLRAKLQLANERPTTPFSANVRPFDYASAEAHAIAKEMNAGLDSRAAAVMIRIGSQGVIYEGRLYFWSKSSGPAYFIGPWRPGTGRPPLHHVIWEQHNGPVPDGHTVRHVDGNRNNLDPANLYLATRNDVCRENQYQALNKKSRAITALLLTRSQTQNPNAHTSLIKNLRPEKHR